MTAAEWGVLAFLGLIWGGSFFFNEIALRELPPLSFVALRLALGAAVLLIVMRARRLSWPRERGLWGLFLAIGVLNAALPFCLIVWAQTRIDSGTASILNATTPLFTVLVAHGFTRDEKLTPNKLAGVAAGLAGVAVLIGPEAVAGLSGHLVAELAVVGAALSYACAGVLGRAFGAHGVAPLVAAVGPLVCAAALLAPLALIVDRPWTPSAPGPATWGAVAGVALLSTALAYVLLFRLLAAVGAGATSLVTLLVPVSAVLLGAAFLGERLGGGHVAGMALIALGLALSDGRVASWAARRVGRVKSV